MDLFNSALGKNITFIPTYFILSGLTGISYVKYYYVFLIFVYMVSVMGNCTMMAVIYLDHNLKSPKYIAVFSLALSDLFSSTTLVPKIIDTFLFDNRYMSYNNVLTYCFFTHIFLGMQSLNLVILSYDRLVAISFPLHYHAMVTHRSMYEIVVSSWLIVIVLTLILTVLHTRLSLCHSLVINSFFVDYGKLLRMACNSLYMNFILDQLLHVMLLWLPLLFILATYSLIGIALSKIRTSQDRFKAMKTCSSHLLLVGLHYLPVVCTFSLDDLDDARVIHLSLTAMIPCMFNPIIYVLQTQELKESVKKRLKFKRLSKITNGLTH